MPKCVSPPKRHSSGSTVTPTKGNTRARSIRIAYATAGMIIRPSKAWRCSRVIPICKYWTRQARASISSRYQIGHYVKYFRRVLHHGAKRRSFNFRVGSVRPPKRIKAGLTPLELQTLTSVVVSVMKHFPMMPFTFTRKGRSAQHIFARPAAAVKMSTDPNAADGLRDISID